MKTEALEVVEHSNLLLSPSSIFSTSSKVSKSDIWHLRHILRFLLLLPVGAVRLMTASECVKVLNLLSPGAWPGTSLLSYLTPLGP